jgi:hypothetical protein
VTLLKPHVTVGRWRSNPLSSSSTLPSVCFQHPLIHVPEQGMKRSETLLELNLLNSSCSSSTVSSRDVCEYPVVESRQALRLSRRAWSSCSRHSGQPYLSALPPPSRRCFKIPSQQCCSGLRFLSHRVIDIHPIVHCPLQNKGSVDKARQYCHLDASCELGASGE